MLQEIQIENLAVIEQLNVELPAGFIVLTGETGAGKSLVIQALELIAGGRATADLIRTGAEQALIEARVSLASSEARRRLAEEGYGDDGEIVVRRILRPDGAHRVYVNGRMATAGLLQELVGPEVEIHAQHSQQRLLDTAVQRQLLDRYGGHRDLLQEVAARWDAWRAIEERLDDLRVRGEGREQEIDYLRFQLEELRELSPQAGEAEQLRELVHGARDALRAAEAVGAVRDLLIDADGSALDRLYSAAQVLTGATPALQSLAAQLDDLAEALKDLVRRFPQSEIEDAADLERAEARLARYERLARKHGTDPDGLVVFQRETEQRLADLEVWDERIVELEARASQAGKAWAAVAQELSNARRSAGQRLAEAVTARVRTLDMPHAQVRISGYGEGAPRRSGCDDIRIELAANPGDVPRPLRQVASGGELSRILLAVQTETGCLAEGGTVVFDEADAGIGGETALTVGRMLRELGEQVQVLVVTHTAQVAAAAHHQIHLEKGIDQGRAVTRARRLDAAGRVAELATMLGGRDSDTAGEHAAELLRRVGEGAASRPDGKISE